MSNAKLRTTTLLRYVSSSQKSAAHIFGNPDCILLPVCFQSCARLWRTNLFITRHYLTSKKTTKQSLKFFTDLEMRFNAVLNCLFVLHYLASLFLSKNKTIRTNLNQPLNGNLLSCGLVPLIKLQVTLKKLYNNKTHTSNRIFTVEMPVVVIASLVTATLWKATVILRYNSMSQQCSQPQ